MSGDKIPAGQDPEDEELGPTASAGAVDDQSGADLDQTSADVDQGASERDQRAADRDQESADRDEARARSHDGDGDAAGYARSRRDRARSTLERDFSTHARSETANARDAAAELRDQAAAARDAAAEGRDQLAAELDAAAERLRTEQRERDRDPVEVARQSQLAAERRDAAEARERAARARKAAARDRRMASRDRERAAADRRAASHELAMEGVDPVTGALRRRPGLDAISREMDRTLRAGQSLIIAFVDVDHLKAVNDQHGHIAGDQALRAVVRCIAENLRSYDLIVRYGGDEFLCSMTGHDLPGVAQRLATVSARLADAAHHPRMTVGLAERIDDEPLPQLVARADAAMMHARRGRQPRPGGYRGVAPSATGGCDPPSDAGPR